MAVEILGFNGTNGDAIPAPWFSNFTASGSATIQSNAAKLATPTTTASFSRLLWQKEYSQVDILVLVTPAQAWTTDAAVAVGVRDITNGANRLFMQVTNAGTNLNLLNVNTTLSSGTVAMTASNPNWFRFRRVGDWVACKIWDSTTNEPGGWQLASRTTSTPTNVMVPWFQASNSTTITAVAAYSFSSITLDDLRPIRAAFKFRRVG